MDQLDAKPIGRPEVFGAAHGANLGELPVPLARMNRDGRLLGVNGRFCRLVGHPAEALIGRCLHELRPSQDRAAAAALPTALPDGEGHEARAEMRLVRGDGTVVPVRLTLQSEHDADGRPAALLAAFEDLSGLRQLEAALAHERELLRQIVDNVPVLLFLFHPDTGRLKLNRHFATVLGWRTEDARSPDFLARVCPDPRQHAELLAFLHSPDPAWHEWSLCARDGTRVPVEWTGMQLGNGTRVGIGLDRRQRKINEARFATQAARRALLLEVTGRLLQNGQDEGALVRTVFAQVGAALDAEVCLAYRCLQPGGPQVLVAACGVAAERLDEAQGLAPGLPLCCVPAVASGTGPVASLPSLQEAQGVLAEALGLSACLCHPLVSPHGQLLGVFTLASTRREAFTQDEADFVQALCHFIALGWERIRFERELRRREQQHRLALAAGRLGTWRRDLRTGLVEMDERAQAHFGFRQPGVALGELLARVHPEDRPRLDALLRTMSAAQPDERSHGIEYRITHPDGSEHWLAMEAAVFGGDDGAKAGRMCVGTSADVIERKRIQHALQQTAAELQRAQSVARVGSWYFDFRRRWGRWSEESCRILGVLPGFPMDHAAFLERVHPQDRHGVEARWRAALAGEPFDLEHRVLVDGEEKWLRLKAELEFDRQGRATEAYGMVQDITERKRADEALQQVERDRAEAARRKDEFLATLAHELRNPLSPIRSAAKVLSLCACEDPRVRWSSEVIERQVRHLSRLIDDLLDLSRLTLNKLGLQPRHIALREVIDGALETVLPLVERRQHELGVELPPQDIVLEGDPVRLVQVFQNLLDNAAKYTPTGGRITVSAECRDRLVEVRVRDSGIGIGAAMLERVFEMFYQGERPAREGGGGLGIGLTLVQRLVQMHGGSIEARSAGEGQGSEFVVRLPVAQAPHAQPASGAPVRGTSLRRCILVVDDNVDSAEGIAELLRAMGHEVHLAHDGLQAVGEAERLRPALVLLDIGMPVLDGYGAARRIRASDWGRGMLLVAQTGWGQQDDVRRAREAGFDAHLTKPVDPEALMRLAGQGVLLPAS
ncbi:PAS domain S-box protein [Caldimonas tepidiphila]|uniref:PAS domain S-box protein n=1 Tax=Caldimonas tepidiphila TaxID=2315841 RepID=UPI000E5A64B2|nr:PAS domain S-box protein [Caldimonas tepidiphila]